MQPLPDYFGHLLNLDQAWKMKSKVSYQWDGAIAGVSMKWQNCISYHNSYCSINSFSRDG